MVNFLKSPAIGRFDKKFVLGPAQQPPRKSIIILKAHVLYVYIQSNLPSLSVPIDVNNTPTAPAETTDIHHEPINTALDEDGPASLSYTR